jgi:hypothetical protein
LRPFTGNPDTPLKLDVIFGRVKFAVKGKLLPIRETAGGKCDDPISDFQMLLSG